MEKDLALNYEYLIRRSHQVARFGTKGANADNYRSFISSYHYYQESLRVHNHPQLSKREKDFLKEMNEISGYMIKALNTALKKFSGKFTQSEKEALAAISQVLTAPTVDTINESIIKAENIMVAHQIFPA